MRYVKAFGRQNQEKSFEPELKPFVCEYIQEGLKPAPTGFDNRKPSGENTWGLYRKSLLFIEIEPSILWA
jgi:hypothetical protein